MPAPVELSLASLLPTVAFLPPELISLSNSLISQSRSKAASLNRDEEIARTYACCHLACRRLEKSLDLEIGKPSPPVAPRIYTKLLGYLEGVLGRAGGTPGRRTEKKADTPGKNPTPSKTAAVVKTPTTAGSKRAREETEHQHGEGQEIPDFAMPLLRHVSKSLGVPNAAPHVLVGAQAALNELRSRNTRREQTSNRKRRKTATPQRASKSAPEEEESVISNDKFPSLLVALCIPVIEKMLSEENPNLRKEALSAAKEFCKERREIIGVDLRSLGKDVDFYALEAEDSGWLGMEWFANVPENVADLGDDDQEEDEKVATPSKSKPSKTPLRRKEKHGDKHAVSEVGAAGLLPGLGTMFQPSLDFLSPERRKDYAVWKKNILREIEQKS